MSSHTSLPPAVPQNVHRLPTNVKPIHYDLTFWTDLQSGEFGGFVAIDLIILEETSSIALNCSDDLNLANASFQCDALGTNFLQSAQVVEKALDRVTLNVLTPLPAGSKAQLKIHYNAKLRGSMTGYYKSSWTRDGRTEYYALTHFQPTDARAAFPCWDEPLLKATFAVTMVSRAGTVNLSNMHSISEMAFDPVSALDADLASLALTLPSDSQWKITKFEKTPPMSSYIVAFANGPFAYLEKIVVMPLSGRSIPLRIYATPDLSHQAEFGLDVTAKVLPLYEKMFDIEYPLAKLDILAVGRFTHPHPKNWGLITGRTVCVLVDPKKNDISARKNVAGILSHEVAHMWFGNITTMEWWDNLYLNEGFASLMGEAIILGLVFPEWGATSNFISGHLSRGLALDAKRSSHPVEVDCPDANFISQIFDALSYSKAASVLRMLSEFVGEERFLQGVSLYLKSHLYQNSVTRDLWDGVSSATVGLDIAHLMDNWITKIGYPVITVTESSAGIRVRQDRFLNSGAPDATENDTIWNVPLAILTVGAAGQIHIDKTVVLEEREKTIALDTSRHFKLNARTVGFYRVLYTPERLLRIATEAAKGESIFSLDDRLGLLDDVAELAKGGLGPSSSLLALADIWRNESNCNFADMVWQNILSNVGVVLRSFREHPQLGDSLRMFIRTLFVPLVQRLGYEFSEGESVDIMQLRTVAISGASAGRDPSVIQELRDRFAEYMKTGDESKIPSNIKQAVLVAAARFGGRNEFEALLKIIEESSSPALKSTAVGSIGFTEDPGLVQELFSYILTKARDQDVYRLCTGIKSSPVGLRMLANFFKDNYDVFSKRFATNSNLPYLVGTCFNGLSTQADYNDIQEFFKANTSRYSMALAQTLEAIQVRVTYIEVRL
ncbi:leucyl aminopeptidase [Mycena pura]|uniref:Aminopeptidase n=1 Tax=Mycena pura TaxID=153505 RepID=A0AAD6YDU1_9AGAR|nr:leucyl aminopeptidase [Mycena pura]